MLNHVKQALCCGVSQDFADRPPSLTSQRPTLQEAEPLARPPATGGDRLEISSLLTSNHAIVGSLPDRGILMHSIREAHRDTARNIRTATRHESTQDGTEVSESKCTHDPKVEAPDDAEKRDREKAVLKGVARTTLAATRALSEAFAPLKGVVECLDTIVGLVDKYAGNEDTMKSLAKHIDQIRTAVLQGPLSEHAEGSYRQVLENALKDVIKKLDHIRTATLAVKVITVEDNATTITECLIEVERALDVYQVSLNHEIRGMVAHQQAVLGDVRNEQLTRNDSDILDKLRTAMVPGAVFRPERPGCLVGTRTGILGELTQWAADPDAPQVYWLNGHAGSGKSAIAQSFAMNLSSHRGLWASFFCNRNSQDRSNVERILPTLSSQLVSSERFREALLEELKVDANLVTSVSLVDQLKHLIVSPAAKSGISAVLLIDALDECNDLQSISTLLSLLINELARIPSVKLFITSRAEPHINKSLTSTSASPHIIVPLIKELHQVDAATVEGDIRLYLETELRSIASDCTLEGLEIPPDWPEKVKVDALVKRSAKSFIFASTIVKAIKDLRCDPVIRLNEIVSGDSEPQDTDNPYAELDKLYLRILVDAFPAENKARTATLRSIIGLLAVACEPLRLATITEILSITKNTVVITLRLLHAVLLVPNAQDTPIVFHHKSFIDFLTQRCDDRRFHIDLSQHHFGTARRCLDLMSGRYRAMPKNICDLRRYSRNSDLSVAERDAHISQALSYSCHFWADHLLADHERDTHLVDTEPLLLYFVKTMHLWWFEVLGLLQELHKALEMLRRIRGWLLPLNSTGKYEHLIEWIDEGTQFVSFAFDAIQESVAHIYHSALPLSPSNSMYRQLWSIVSDMDAEAKVVIGAEQFWAARSRVIRMPGKVSVVRYSPDGTLIAAGGDGFCRLISATTGELLSELESDPSQEMRLGALAFCPTRPVLATADGARVTLWDTVTATMLSELGGRGGNIRELDFHSNNHGLLSMDEDGHVFIWDTTNSKEPNCIYRFTVDSASSCGAVCWLPMPEHCTIIVGCEGADPVEIWEVAKLDSPPQLLRRFSLNAQTAGVEAIAVSRDGVFIAAATDCSLTVYNADTGNVVHSTSFAHCAMFSLDFSPLPPYIDLLVFTSSNEVGLFYPMREEEPVVRLSGHSAWVQSVVFSPDGQFIATGSDDQTVRIWEIARKGRGFDSYVHSASKTTFAHFSLDGRFIVSGFDDKTIRIWSATDGILLKVLPKYSSQFCDGVFLLDDTYAVCCGDDGNLLLWDWEQGGILHQSALALQNHGRLRRAFPSTHKRLGFFSSHVDLNDWTQWTVCYWEVVQVEDAGQAGPNSKSNDVQLHLLAQGSLQVPSGYITRIHDHKKASGAPGTTVIVESFDDTRFVASLVNLDMSHDTPQTLSFTEDSVRTVEPVKSLDSYIGLEKPCLRSTDDNWSWVVDGRGRKILWLPPIHRGWGRWWESKLLLQRDNGRLTLIDFSHVDLDSDDLF